MTPDNPILYYGSAVLAAVLLLMILPVFAELFGNYVDWVKKQFRSHR